jgi:hypothetical protein
MIRQGVEGGKTRDKAPMSGRSRLKMSAQLHLIFIFSLTYLGGIHK